MAVDLRLELPHQVRVGDGWADVVTDFRAWLDYGEALRRGFVSLAIWPGMPPAGEWLDGALEFYESPNPFPRGRRGGARAFDYLLDGDYIVAAYQQAYGIDLTDPGLGMHWHRFVALFRGLPESTRLARIMAARSWTGQAGKRSEERERRREREAWALPSDTERSAARHVPYESQADPLAALGINDEIPQGV